MKYLYLPPKKKFTAIPLGQEYGGDCTCTRTHAHGEMGDSNLIPGEDSPHPLQVKRNACEIYLQKFRPQHGGGAQSHLPTASSIPIFFFSLKKKREVTTAKTIAINPWSGSRLGKRLRNLNAPVKKFQMRALHIQERTARLGQGLGTDGGRTRTLHT